MDKRKSEKGLLSLEASIVVTMFIFFVLFLYSFFIIFEARNEMAHVLLTTTNSLSLDAYETGKLKDTENLSALFYLIYEHNKKDDKGFTTTTKWHEASSGTDADGNPVIATALEKAIKDRFIAYLADGDTTEANRILDMYNIVGGVDGLDFSASKVESGNLHVNLEYTLEYQFNMFGLGKMKFKQSACSKLWGVN